MSYVIVTEERVYGLFDDEEEAYEWLSHCQSLFRVTARVTKFESVEHQYG